MTTKAPSWRLYVLRCGDGSLYAGIANDVERRLAEHRSGGARAARYVRGRGPLALVASWRVTDRSTALRVELRFKRLRKEDKEALVAKRGRRLPACLKV